jgi:hypothetical protein
MKSLIAILGGIFFLVSCNDGDTSHSKNVRESSDSVTKVDSCAICFSSAEKFSFYTWFSEVDNNGKPIVCRGKFVDSVATIEEAITYFNGSGLLRVIKNGEVGDTLSVKLEHSELFTQQMGTTGANMFRVALIYTLTDHFGYNYVDIQFEEGDHGGQPGIYSRMNPGSDPPLKVCK